MKDIKDKKLFVGGYYDDRKFPDECFEGKTPFDDKIDTYSFDEVLKLGFVENVKEYNAMFSLNGEWDNLTTAEQIIEIIDYVETDDIAGLVYFANGTDAEAYKNQVLEEIKEIEKRTFYAQQKQDEHGNFIEVWKLISTED